MRPVPIASLAAVLLTVSLCRSGGSARADGAWIAESEAASWAKKWVVVLGQYETRAHAVREAERYAPYAKGHAVSLVLLPAGAFGGLPRKSFVLVAGPHRSRDQAELAQEEVHWAGDTAVRFTGALRKARTRSDPRKEAIDEQALDIQRAVNAETKDAGETLSKKGDRYEISLHGRAEAPAAIYLELSEGSYSCQESVRYQTRDRLVFFFSEGHDADGETADFPGGEWHFYIVGKEIVKTEIIQWGGGKPRHHSQSYAPKNAAAILAHVEELRAIARGKAVAEDAPLCFDAE